MPAGRLLVERDQLFRRKGAADTPVTGFTGRHRMGSSGIVDVFAGGVSISPTIPQRQDPTAPSTHSCLLNAHRCSATKKQRGLIKVKARTVRPGIVGSQTRGEFGTWQKEFLRKHGGPAPRYTSYPTAPGIFMRESMAMSRPLAARAQAGTDPLALYPYPLLRPAVLVLWLQHKADA